MPPAGSTGGDDRRAARATLHPPQPDDVDDGPRLRPHRVAPCATTLARGTIALTGEGPDQAPATQCSTRTSGIGKCRGLPVASRALTPTAAAATRQSAWLNVSPRAACSRRQDPASAPSARPSVQGSPRPRGARRRAPRSVGDRGESSSRLTAHVNGRSRARAEDSSPAIAPGRPRSRSMSTVVSSRSPRGQPTRRGSARRSSETQAATSSSQSCPRAVDRADRGAHGIPCLGVVERATHRAFDEPAASASADPSVEPRDDRVVEMDMDAHRVPPYHTLSNTLLGPSAPG